MAAGPADGIVLTNAQMAAVDRAAVAAGLPLCGLMEAAGAAVAEAARARLPPGGRVLVLCGPGNNGGDGFVAARLLRAAGHEVTLAAISGLESYRGVAAEAARDWAGAIEELTEAHLEGPWDLVVDALFGAGLARPLEGRAAQVVQKLNACQLSVLAVDVPSGLSGDSGEALGGLAVQADATVTFCRYKPAHLLLAGRAHCGRVQLADIGIPDDVVRAALEGLTPVLRLCGPALGAGLRRRTPESYKYDFGYVLIRGGATMAGAGRLAARAALRGGAGLVAVAAPAASLPLYALTAASLILLPAETPDDWIALLRDRRRVVLLLGPGGGTGPETRAAVEAALATGRTSVLDADALTVFAGELPALAAQVRGPVVLTPHEGEFARLWPDLTGDKLSRAQAAARQSGAVVLLKGGDTVVASPDGRAALAYLDAPALAAAGSGDVLAGLLAALLAQGLPPFEAAGLAVWMHARAGQLGGDLPGGIADDLPERFPEVFSEFL